MLNTLKKRKLVSKRKDRWALTMTFVDELTKTLEDPLFEETVKRNFPLDPSSFFEERRVIEALYVTLRRLLPALNERELTDYFKLVQTMMFMYFRKFADRLMYI